VAACPGGPSPVRRMGCERLLLGLWRAEADKPASRATGLPALEVAAGLTATLRGDPIEHGNIRIVESSGQGLRRAVGLRYHDLRNVPPAIGWSSLSSSRDSAVRLE
jgi:hypothetical protein